MEYTEESLRDDIRNKEARIDRLRRENRALDQELSRVRKAKKRVSQAKKAYSELREATRKSLDVREEWKGERYDKCERSFESLYRTDKDALNRIDDVLDTLERAEGEYERKMNSNNGLIGTLQNGINWAWHEIKTWFN